MLYRIETQLAPPGAGVRHGMVGPLPGTSSSRRRNTRWLWAALAAAVPLAGAALAVGVDDFEEAPIRYSKSTPADPVARLQARLDRGETKLQRDGERGYLPSVLRELGIPVSS